MGKKKKWKLRNVNTLLMLTVFIISIGVGVFAGMTIVNTDNLAQYTSEIYQQPYAVNEAAWKMRLHILYARNTMLNMLTDDRFFDNQKENLDQLYEHRKQHPAIERVLEEQYKGYPKTITTLINDFNMMRSLHDYCIELIYQGKTNEARAILYGEAYPIYREADKLIAQVIEESQQDIADYVERTNQLNDQTNFMALVWGSALILLTILLSTLSVRTISKRNEDIYHNDMLFKIISENVDDVFMIYDCVDKKVEFLSENAERILGLQVDDFKRNMWISRSFFSDEEFDKIRKAQERVNNREIVEYDFIMRDPKTKTEKEMHSRLYPIIEDGVIVKHVFVTSDLTAEKASKRMLESALDVAQSANEAKRQFLSRMSHEIRTPLNTIIGLIEVMKNACEAEKKPNNDLKKINIAAQHLLELINDLLDMSKIESGKMEFEEREFSLNVMLSEIAMIMEPKMEEKNQIFDVMLRDVINDRFVGAELRIRQVLLNFLSNAVKFTPEGGKIKVKIRQLAQRGDEACLSFSVKDNGIGMSEEFMDRIFLPFEQENAGISHTYGGTGLGMALSKSFVETMGGEIEVQSAEGKGSTFSFNLWLKFADAPLSDRETLETFKGLRVLLVDDEEEMRDHLRLICEQLGIASEIAESGAGAVHMIKNAAEPFDIAFVDLYMPDVDGIRTTQWIKNEAKNDIRVVLMSAYDYKRVEQEARDAGVDAFLTKPVLRESMYQVVGDLEGGSEAAQENEPSADFSGKRMLLVDDSELNREIGQALSEHVGFEVETAEDGKQAVDMFMDAEPGYYDVIMMDVQMPVLNGYEATQAIRMSGKADAKDIVILAMTANSFKEDVAESIKNGMDAHIAKPIDAKVVFAILKDYLL
ncbi:MAG: response regulator [Christensenella sp.]|uniref:response regulator n=1 Tax=Christensenella sp. TaxID=1935934 RepID=UPI002B21D4BF|nr:response regulator [Christensenella sp.]MEA5003991.1 response regulator [Christensenella sp.]